jgi:hypothetical protein
LNEEDAEKNAVESFPRRCFRRGNIKASEEYPGIMHVYLTEKERDDHKKQSNRFANKAVPESECDGEKDGESDQDVECHCSAS